MNQVHDLKTIQPFFDHIVADAKTFEVRKDDRGYITGDILVLREWDGSKYTGRHVCKRVSYVLVGGGWGIEAGHVVMGLGHTEDIYDGDYGAYADSPPSARNESTTVDRKGEPHGE